MAPAPLFIGSDIYRSSSYGGRHPLAISRVSTVIDLVRVLGWLDPAAYVESPLAPPDELVRFHAPDYIAALRRAEADQHIAPETSRRFNIGCNGNPLFPEIFSRPATACGASLKAAEILLGARDGAIVYSPAGGTHHGRSDRAAGFCYLNDPVLAMLRLLDGGVGSILYVDLDAHHCDGVADAFAGDERVIMVSVHEEARTTSPSRASCRKSARLCCAASRGRAAPAATRPSIGSRRSPTRPTPDRCARSCAGVWRNSRRGSTLCRIILSRPYELLFPSRRARGVPHARRLRRAGGAASTAGAARDLQQIRAHDRDIGRQAAFRGRGGEDAAADGAGSHVPPRHGC
jgi:hypothetical protein